MSRIYVGNLNFRTNEQSLTKLFAVFGDVLDVAVIRDPASGKSRGFGFIEMAEPDSLSRAIEALNGNAFEGRTLVVSEAKPRGSSKQQ